MVTSMIWTKGKSWRNLPAIITLMLSIFQPWILEACSVNESHPWLSLIWKQTLFLFHVALVSPNCHLVLLGCYGIWEKPNFPYEVGHRCCSQFAKKWSPKKSNCFSSGGSDRKLSCLRFVRSMLDRCKMLIERIEKRPWKKWYESIEKHQFWKKLHTRLPWGQDVARMIMMVQIDIVQMRFHV